MNNKPASDSPPWSQRALKTARSLLVYALIVVVGAVAGNLWMTRNQASGPAPELIGQALDGRLLRIDYAAFDQPLVVYFFADWCPICKLQNSAIESIGEDYPVIAVAMQSGDLDNVIDYVRGEGMELNVINDQSGALSRNFSVNGVPASFIIDNSGVIRSSTRGYTSRLSLRARLWLSERGWI